jgi:hypothetical protein
VIGVNLNAVVTATGVLLFVVSPEGLAQRARPVPGGRWHRPARRRLDDELEHAGVTGLLQRAADEDEDRGVVKAGPRALFQPSRSGEEEDLHPPGRGSTMLLRAAVPSSWVRLGQDRAKMRKEDESEARR